MQRNQKNKGRLVAEHSIVFNNRPICPCRNESCIHLESKSSEDEGHDTESRGADRKLDCSGVIVTSGLGVLAVSGGGLAAIVIIITRVGIYWIEVSKDSCFLIKWKTLCSYQLEKHCRKEMRSRSQLAWILRRIGLRIQMGLSQRKR